MFSLSNRFYTITTTTKKIHQHPKSTLRASQPVVSLSQNNGKREREQRERETRGRDARTLHPPPHPAHTPPPRPCTIHVPPFSPARDGKTSNFAKSYGGRKAEEPVCVRVSVCMCACFFVCVCWETEESLCALLEDLHSVGGFCQAKPCRILAPRGDEDARCIGRAAGALHVCAKSKARRGLFLKKKDCWEKPARSYVVGES